MLQSYWMYVYLLYVITCMQFSRPSVWLLRFRIIRWIAKDWWIKYKFNFRSKLERVRYFVGVFHICLHSFAMVKEWSNKYLGQRTVGPKSKFMAIMQDQQTLIILYIALIIHIVHQYVILIFLKFWI